MTLVVIAPVTAIDLEDSIVKGLFFLLGKPDALQFNCMLQLEVQNVNVGKEGPRYR